MHRSQSVIGGNQIALGLMGAAREAFFSAESMEWKQALLSIAELTGVHPYTVDLLLLLTSADTLREHYRSHGLEEAVFWDTIKDVRCKMMECHTVFGVWGTACLGWQRGFFLMDRFALGRLQYERRTFPKDSYADHIRRGEPALVCHIPSGEPLAAEQVFASLKQAYRFFPDTHIHGKLAVICNSWMLYPGYGQLFPASSNLAKFRAMFHVIDQKTDPDKTEFWRIFDCPWDPNIKLDDLPCKTSLQREMIRHLKNGGTMGSGWGILLFDGENIL